MDIEQSPNQSHLLNKYQINMGFIHFHKIGILTGMNILAPYQIDIVVSVMGKLYYYFFLPTNHDFGRGKQYLFDILFFTGLKKILF